MTDRRRVRARPGTLLTAVCLLVVAGCARGSEPAAPAGTAASRAASASSAASHAGLRLPPPGGRFDYQIGGPYPPDPAVQIVERDHGSVPVPGRYTICYVNAFQTQPEDAALWSGNRAPLLLHDAAGRTVGDPDWPGELLLDTSSPTSRAGVQAVVAPWIAECARRGFDAVELDNLDSWTRSHGRLTATGNLALATALVTVAHRDGLAVAQKNAVDMAASARATAGFDFAVAEECEQYSECDGYTAAYGREVLEIEYTDNGRAAFERACAARGRTISVILRDRQVLPRGRSGYHNEACS